MFKNSIGLVSFGSLGRNLFYEFQLFALIRDFKDGITFFNFNLNFDRYKSEHTPSFQIELTILNIYNHLWVYQNNPDEEYNDFIS